METLGQKQWRFMRQLAKLIDFALAAGYELSGGELKRPPEMAVIYAKQGIGVAHSLHILGLAIDLMLFKDGIYLTRSEDYEPLGKFWESLSPDSCWGGRFLDELGRPKPDGDHFSITHGGVK